MNRLQRSVAWGYLFRSDNTFQPCARHSITLRQFTGCLPFTFTLFSNITFFENSSGILRGTSTLKETLYLLLFLLTSLQTSSLFAQEKLRWGADPSGGAPYVFADPSNPSIYIGFDAEIAGAIAGQLGMEAELVPTDWASIVESLKRKEFDVIINGFEPTTDRAKQIIFSKPYYIFRLQLTVRKNQTGIDSLADCIRQKKVVGTLANCAASRLLESSGAVYKEYPDPVAAYVDLQYNRLDAVLMDVPMEMFYARKNPALKNVGPLFLPGTYVVGLRNEDSLLQKKINTAIDTLIHNGTIERIMRKWELWDSEQSKLLKTGNTFQITGRAFSWSEAIIKLGKAALVTVLIAFGSMIIAMILGVPLAFGQTYGSKPVRYLCTVYIEFFRGTPVLVQLLFLYFGLPVIGISLPGWLTALIGLGLNYAAYESQIYRTAFQSVPQRQWDVSYSLGMKPFLTFRRIIFPQAFRIALPPMTNDFVALFKDTSTAFAISVWELATAYREVANASGEFLLLGVVVAGFYLLMSLPLAHYAKKLENKMNPAYKKPVEGNGGAI